MKMNHKLSLIPNKKCFLVLFILFTFSCDFNTGIDTADAIRVNDAFAQITNAFNTKYQTCFDEGNVYYNFNQKSIGNFRAINVCNSELRKNNEGYFLWIRDVNRCLNLIHFFPCPPSFTGLDTWSQLIYNSCNLKNSYFINSYKPGQGKLLLTKSNFYDMDFNCL